MATSKKATSSKAAQKTAAAAEHSHAALEAEVAGLKKLIEDLAKETKALSEKCDACCTQPSGSDPELEAKVNKIWRWVSRDRLFKHFQ